MGCHVFQAILIPFSSYAMSDYNQKNEWTTFDYKNEIGDSQDLKRSPETKLEEIPKILDGTKYTTYAKNRAELFRRLNANGNRIDRTGFQTGLIKFKIYLNEMEFNLIWSKFCMDENEITLLCIVNDIIKGVVGD